MALGRKKTKIEPRALIASAAAVRLSEPIWMQATGADGAWQAELWRLYRTVSEFARAANYVGQACSRVRIYVADVDNRGQVQKEVAPTNPVGKLAYSVLGGPEKQAELLNLAGTAAQVSGEHWTVALSVDEEDEDKWFVVQYRELVRLDDFLSHPGGDPQRQFSYATGDKTYTLREGRDIIFRTWTPDPEETIRAYSPGRSLQMTLTELEILTQYILAQARSRLASGGVWPWPAATEFPTDDSEPVGAESLMKRLMDAAETNLSKFGGASQLIPMLVELPTEVLDKIKDPIIFGSVLSEQAMKLREECRGVIAKGMDIAPEIVSGMGDSTHWNGPMIEQSTVDTVIKPIMVRICNALTTYYLKPALIALGKDPKRYRFWFDTAALITRPNKLKETLEMAAQGYVGIDEVLRAADLPDSAKPSAEEAAKALAIKLLLSDSNMILIPELRKLAGLPIKSVAPDGQALGDTAQAVAGRAPAPPPPPRTLSETPQTSPTRSTLPNAPNNAVPGNQNSQPRAMTASADALVIGADMQVRQALEKVGKALLRGPRGGQFSQIPFDEVYLTVPVGDPARAAALLASGFGYVPGLMESIGRSSDADAVRGVLIEYCVERVVSQKPHEVRVMRGHLEREGLL